MKKHIALVVAGLLIGGILFLLAYKVFRADYGTSLSLAIGGAAAGVVVEYFKPVLTRKHNRDTRS